MNTASKIIGFIALLVMIVGLVPFLGWLNWLVIPVALLGLIVGIFSKNTGGLILNGIILIFSAIRLMAGGGII
jgi:TRAP-type mannitol/chloroaromatic compound transport system permease small subunit